MIINKLCCLCNEAIYNNDICAKCWNKFIFINHSCNKCGYLINKHNTTSEASNNFFKCKNCPNEIDKYIYKNISVFDYNNIGKNFILKLKNINSYYKILSSLNSIIKINKILQYKIDFITYVPSHFIKYLIRGFNQSELIAKIISNKSNINIKSLLVKKNLRSQSSRSFNDRKKNMSNVFKINKNECIHNKTVLIVDDVMTTGSTLMECANILKNNGAKKIITFTLARTGLKKYINT